MATPHFDQARDPGIDPETTASIERAEFVRFVPPAERRGSRAREADHSHLALLFRNPGDSVKFSVSAPESTMIGSTGSTDLLDVGQQGVGTVWIVTESGNRYGIHGGRVFNYNEGAIYGIAPDATELVVRQGQQLVIPGVATTSAVRSFLVGDELGPYSEFGKGEAAQARTVNTDVDLLGAVRDCMLGLNNPFVDPQGQLASLRMAAARAVAQQPSFL